MFATKQQVLDAFHFRCATRYYDPERKISKEDFDYILEPWTPVAKFRRIRAMAIFSGTKSRITPSLKTGELGHGNAVR